MIIKWVYWLKLFSEFIGLSLKILISLHANKRLTMKRRSHRPPMEDGSTGGGRHGWWG